MKILKEIWYYFYILVLCVFVFLAPYRIIYDSTIDNTAKTWLIICVLVCIQSVLKDHIEEKQ